MGEVTLDLIMSTRPCSHYPRDTVSALLAKYGPFKSWEHLAEVARAAEWPVSLADLRLTAYKTATPAQREVAVRHSTKVRVEAQVRRWPNPPAAVVDVRRRLLAWAGGGSEAISQLKHDAARCLAALATTAAAQAAYDAAYDADAAAAAPRVAAYTVNAVNAAYASADASYASADAYDAYHWESLLYICRLLDTDSPVKDITVLEGSGG